MSGISEFLVARIRGRSRGFVGEGCHHPIAAGPENAPGPLLAQAGVVR
ncbi:hypothetical protein QFZ69_001494 [Arthrobacter sp. V1I7]|nr:hypothetical protein [Arthrobacter sp. V1I7]MDQ0820615.1 hypothetical protein [Arthrobacter sp. V1I7]